MQLIEFVDKDGKKINLQQSLAVSTTTSSGSSNIGYKKRFEKLLDYHINHKDKDVEKILQKDIRNFGVDYSEHHKGEFEGGYDKEVSIKISDTENWYFTVKLDNRIIANKSGKGWDTFVWEISFYLNLPELTTDPEYQDLLEWSSSPALKTEHYSGNKRVLQKTRETVQKIIVDPGVEEIYNNTFSYCEELQEVSLPETVTRIDNFAFYACSKLTKINLPSSISFIAAQAFEGCPKVVIYCEKDSYAEEFAKGRGIPVTYTNTSSIAEDFRLYESLWD